MFRKFVAKLVGAVLVGVGVGLLLFAAIILFFLYVFPRLFNTLPPPDEGKTLAWMGVAVAVVFGCLSLWGGRSALIQSRSDPNA